MIKLTFLGGAGSIGASSTLVQVGDTSVLVDCGVRFTKLNPLPDLDALTNTQLDGILVTHAHSDHTGGLPVVHSAYPQTPIYMTPPTSDLVRILQRDALKIMNSEEKESEVPLFSEKHVDEMLENIIPVHFYEKKSIGEIDFTIYPASHIIGAGMIHIETPYGNILFTGDYSVTPQKTVPGLEVPDIHVDILITESTYGNRMHSDRKASENKLVQTVSEVIENGGKVLIPAFAIGRAQEVLTILKQAIANQKLSSVPVYVDGMVRQVCNIYGDHPRYTTPYIAKQSRKGHAFYNKNVTSVLAKSRKDILSGGPCVIVSSSGMLTGGPSAYYAEHLSNDEKNAIVITGYQDEESPGRALLSLLDADNKDKSIAINGRETTISCQIKSYSLSAHADRLQIVSLIDRLNPKTVVLVHGDDEAKKSLDLSLGGLDVIHAQEGMGLNRKYPKRGTSHKKSNIAINRAMLTSLAEANQKPIKIEELALQICQKSVPSKYYPELKDLIVKTGLFIEGEEKDTFFSTKIKLTGKKKIKGKKGAKKIVNLSQEETDLLSYNPKGKLLELCNKAQVGLPKFEREDRGDEHITSVSVQIDDNTYSSLKYIHTKLMVSTQLSYQDLFKQCQSVLESKASNKKKLLVSGRHPKSVLNEICQKYGFQLPFSKEYLDRESLFGIQIIVMISENEIKSKVHYESSKKNAEKMAYEELLPVVMNQLPKSSPKVESNLKNDFKSALFVLCSQKKISAPNFHIRSSATGFVASGDLKIDGKIIKSREYPCANHKSGHQMVSQELIGLFSNSQNQEAGN